MFALVVLLGALCWRCGRRTRASLRVGETERESFWRRGVTGWFGYGRWARVAATEDVDDEDGRCCAGATLTRLEGDGDACAAEDSPRHSAGHELEEEQEEPTFIL